MDPVCGGFYGEFYREGPRGNRADPVCLESFTNLKEKVFKNSTGGNCLKIRNGLNERVFKVAKGEGFGGFEEKIFKESCLKDYRGGRLQNTSLKQEVFKNSKGEVFVVSSESGLKCGVCGIDEELEGEVELSGGVARGAPPEHLEGTVLPGGVASKAPPGRLEGLGDKRELVRLGDPRRPSEQEVEDHCLSGHLPYRNWCYHCVRGRGRDLDHRKGIEEERGLSEFSFDYCFPGDEFGFKLTILAGSERATGMKMATVVPEKGSSGRFSAGKCLEFM